MKILISKSQWEGIGKKAGWNKKALLYSTPQEEYNKMLKVLTDLGNIFRRFPNRETIQQIPELEKAEKLILAAQSEMLGIKRERFDQLR
jgi:hypothetical protein